MNFEIKPLSAGLYFVATPIGTARDITLRALDILASADVIAAEDTRTTKRLMDIHGIALNGRPMIPYHDHNGAKARPGLLKLLTAGKSVAYASEAGSPLVADPGYALAKIASEEGHMVTCAPGPSAPLVALTLSGLPSDRFLFAGFAPNAKAARRKWLGGLADVQATLLIFESPKRIHQMLADMADVLGDRQIALCRELTKRFEEVRRGTVSEVLESVVEKAPKGEIVVVVDRPAPVVADTASIEDHLRQAMETLSRKDAIAQVAADLDVPRRTVYQLALDLDA